MPGRKFIRLFVDVFLTDYVTLAYVDLIARAIREALADVQLPRITATHNAITDAYEIELIEEQMQNLQLVDDKTGDELNLPILFTVGEVEGNFVLDLTTDEYEAVDSLYTVVAISE